MTQRVLYVMKKAVSNIGLTILVILMLAAVGTFLAPRFGWRVDTVLSGSMEPALKVGGVVVTQPVGVEDIREGDVITFYSPLGDRLTTHRVIARVTSIQDTEFVQLAMATPTEESPVYFRTKGDANEDADPFLVPAENVVGKVVFLCALFLVMWQVSFIPSWGFCLPSLSLALSLLFWS